MSLHRFNITKPRDGLEDKSVKEKMEVKQEYHDQKKYNVFKAIFEEANSFWQGDSFSGKTELLGQFLEPNLAHLVDGFAGGFDFS